MGSVLVPAGRPTLWCIATAPWGLPVTTQGRASCPLLQHAAQVLPCRPALQVVQCHHIMPDMSEQGLEMPFRSTLHTRPCGQGARESRREARLVQREGQWCLLHSGAFSPLPSSA